MSRFRTQRASRSTTCPPRRGLIVGLCGLLLVLATTRPLFAAAVVQFKTPVTVSSGVIRLGDLADIQDADPQFVARLRSLSVAPAPSAGKTLQLDFEQIQQRILIQGVSIGQLEFTGASAVTIHGGAVDEKRGPRPVNVSDVTLRRAEEQVERAIARYVTGVLPDVGQVTVQVRLTAEQANHLATSSSSRLEISGGQLPLSEPQQFVAQFVDRLGQQQQLPVTAQVTPWPVVVVAKGNIARGTTIQSQEVELQQIDPSTNAGPYLERVDIVVGQETRRSLRSGEPISPADLRAMPLVRKGDMVTVYSRKGGVSVRLVAQAQSDGSLGQTVTLLVKNSKTPLLARVSGYHEAEISPSTTTGSTSTSTGSTSTGSTTAPSSSGDARLPGGFTNAGTAGNAAAGRDGPHAHLRPTIPASLQPVSPTKSLSPSAALSTVPSTSPAPSGLQSARYMTPLFSTPELSTPELSTPRLGTPQFSTPQFSTPQMNPPHVSTPEIRAPQVTRPQLVTPHLGAPQMSVPQKPSVSSNRPVTVPRISP